MYLTDENKARDKWIDGLDRQAIIDETTFSHIMQAEQGVERESVIAKLEIRAGELGVKRQFQRMFKAYHADAIQQFKNQNGSKHMFFTNSPLKNLNCGEWECNDAGVCRMVTEGWEVKRIYACQHPILPTKRLRNIDDNTEKIEISFYKDKQWQAVTVDRSKLAATAKIIELADRGIEVTSENAKELIKYISDIVALNTEKIPMYNSISRLGWIDGGFAPYRTDVQYDGDMDFKQMYSDISTKGSRDEWVGYCKNLRKNIYLRMMMDASFAAPLIEPLGALPFVLHMWGGTGTGKTVGLMAAMSVWGNPEPGHLVRTLNMTQNAMGRTAAFLYSVPFAGDELQIIKSRWDNMDNLIMYITEGVDRGRAKAYGGVETLKTWRNSFIFTGEEPVTKSRSGGGVKNRVIEIELEGNVIDDGNETANSLRENYGFAGREFTDAVAAEKNIKERYRTIFENVLKSSDTTDKQAMAMSVLLLADELAERHIFGSEPLDVTDVKGFMSSKSEVDAAARAYTWTVDWIAQNENRFSDKAFNGGELWGKIYDDYVMINKKIYAEALDAAGFSYSAVIGKFAERGQIERNSQNKFVHQRKVYGVSASYVKFLLNVSDDFTEIEETEEELPF